MSAGAGGRFENLHWQLEPELAAIRCRSCQLEIAALGDGQITRNGKTKAGAAALFAAKGQEQAAPLLLRNARPVIGNIDYPQPAGSPDIDR